MKFSYFPPFQTFSYVLLARSRHCKRRGNAEGVEEVEEELEEGLAGEEAENISFPYQLSISAFPSGKSRVVSEGLGVETDT